MSARCRAALAASRDAFAATPPAKTYSSTNKGLPPPRPPMSARCRAALAAGRAALAAAPPATPYSSINRLEGLNTFQTEVMSTRVAVQNRPSNTLRASATDARSDGCKNRTATRGSLSTSAPK